MKKFLLYMVWAILASVCGIAQADAVYSYSNPTYIPTATSPSATYSAPFDYLFQSNNIGMATVKVSGTCTGLVAAIQGSNDNGATWATLSGASIPSGSSTRSITAPGMWGVNAGGFNKLRIYGTALTASCAVVMAGTSSGQAVADPCLNPEIMQSSAVVAQGASATTKLVEAVTGSAIYVCGFAATAAGTTPTFTFVRGTRVTADCDTGSGNLSGAMVPSATTGVISIGGRGTVLTAPASNQLCLTTAATTNIQGVLNYVQM